MDLAPASRDELRAPPGIRLVFVTLVAACILQLIPIDRALSAVRPDLPLVLLVYWAIYQPRLVGFIVAFILGIVMDVAAAGVIGQHCLTYVVAVYLALILRVRILKFRLWQQALHVLAILLAAQVVLALTYAFLPSTFPGMTFFLGGVFGALLWLPIAIAIEYLHARRAFADGE